MPPKWITLSSLVFWIIVEVGAVDTSLSIPPSTFLRASDEQAEKYFKNLTCRGTFNTGLFQKVYRICDDCFLLNYDIRAHCLCTDTCFDTYYYTACLFRVGLISEEQTYQRHIRDLQGPAGPRPVTYIESRAAAKWGDWGELELCKEGDRVFGFSLKVEKNQYGGDDTALNAIKLWCSPGDKTRHYRITSAMANWGDWQRPSFCPGQEFAIGFIMRSEKPIEYDNTAANDLRLICDSGRVLEGFGQDWGQWGAEMYCPLKMWVCGLQTQVQKYQGNGDDTALNNVLMKCCGDST